MGGIPLDGRIPLDGGDPTGWGGSHSRQSLMGLMSLILGSTKPHLTSFGQGLLGDDIISVRANGTANYELLFSPLIAGASGGRIAFVNPMAGEFWYELQLFAEEAEVVELPLLHASVGDKVEHHFTVTNPIGEELPLQVAPQSSREWNQSCRQRSGADPSCGGIPHGAGSLVRRIPRAAGSLVRRDPSCGGIPRAAGSLERRIPHSPRTPCRRRRQVVCDNTRNFKLEGPRGQGLVLPPYGELEARLTFTPSDLEMRTTAQLSLTHPKLGEWHYVGERRRDPNKGIRREGSE